MQLALPAAYQIEGYAIVSADGMIADASGEMPPSIHNKADHDFFHGSLDRASAVIHGRHSKERDAGAKHRKRLMMTRAVGGITPDPKNPLALFWNPDTAAFADALAELGVSSGMIAIIGGTDVFGAFLPHYRTFHLTRAARAQLPKGRPVFPGIPPATPEQRLTQSGLALTQSVTLDAGAEVSLATWQRTANR